DAVPGNGAETGRLGRLALHEGPPTVPDGVGRTVEAEAVDGDGIVHEDVGPGHQPPCPGRVLLEQEIMIARHEHLVRVRQVVEPSGELHDLAGRAGVGRVAGVDQHVPVRDVGWNLVVRVGHRYDFHGLSLTNITRRVCLPPNVWSSTLVTI